MADALYGMGQFRYSGASNTCMENKNISVKSLDWQIETDTSPWYRDIIIQLLDSNGNPTNFELDQSYYLEFGIPQDLNYALAFAVDFIEYSGNNSRFRYEESKTVYQFLRYIEVLRKVSEGTTNSLVCLYKIKDKAGSIIDANPRAAISNKSFILDDTAYTNDTSVKRPTTETGVFFEINNPTANGTQNYTYYKNVLYHDRLSDTYWMFDDTDTKVAHNQSDDPFGQNNILEGTNDVMLNWIWETKQQTNMAYFKLIVTPKKGLFNAIVLKMARIQEDRDIITGEFVNNSGGSGDGKSIYGRWVNLKQPTGNTITVNGVTRAELVEDTFKISLMKNINSGGILRSQGNKLTKIGIWGHPELMMAINGEEIKIGSSGYYELNDYNIDKLCVAADGAEDMFVLDYQYIL